MCRHDLLASCTTITARPASAVCSVDAEVLKGSSFPAYASSRNFRIQPASPRHVRQAVDMITRYLTEVSLKFNPFTKPGKVARNFLALLPPNARADGMKIDAKMLPRYSKDTTPLSLKFKDGKQMNLDLSELQIRDVQEEVNRHSRMLARAEELQG